MPVSLVHTECSIAAATCYVRHRPEQTLLYQVVERHYPLFLAELENQGHTLPNYVQREFDNFLKCGRLEYGFLRIRCEACHAEKLVASSCKRRGFCPSCGAKRMVESAALLVDEVLPHLPMRQWVLSVPYPLRFLFAREPKVMSKVLGIVYRTIASQLVRQAGLTHATAHTGAVTLIQRFGSALNLNVHLHMLFLDGVYVATSDCVAPLFRRVPVPTGAHLQRLLERISQRIGRYLERQGLLVRDPEQDYLPLEALDEESACMDRLRGHSISYRIAIGRYQGKKAFTLQTLPAAEPRSDEPLAKANGFSLHAGVWAGANDRAKLERICRYIARPAISNDRVALTECGPVRYTLKTPYRDGTTHVFFNPENRKNKRCFRLMPARLSDWRTAVFSHWRQPIRREAPLPEPQCVLYLHLSTPAEWGFQGRREAPVTVPGNTDSVRWFG